MTDFDPRADATSDERLVETEMAIDPGFVNRRLAETVLPPETLKLVHRDIEALPSHVPDGLREAQIDRIYALAVLALAKWVNAPSIPGKLSGAAGKLVSSLGDVEPTPDFDSQERVRSLVRPTVSDARAVVLEYSTEHVRSTTLRWRLREGEHIATVAVVDREDDLEIVLSPIVLGLPWLSEADSQPDLMWRSYDHFEIFIEDIDEFGKVRDVPMPEDFSVMARISESAFKQCLGEILGDETRKDWGGEQSDHYSTNVHLQGKRSSSAFLLKGPSKFSEMRIAHLGKNGDQLVRLSKEPAALLVVQHSHLVGTDIRDSLRALAVQPGAARRYCVIDGKDSLRLLLAYDKVDRAIELSE